jgi:hypothetical protein
MAIATLALITAAPTLAADFRGLRPAYPTSWETGEDNPLRFEAGMRYWMSWGGQEAAIAGQGLSVNDQTHILELHTRIDDLSTQSYVKTLAGLGVDTRGSYTFGSTSNNIGGDSAIGYVGADFGWMLMGEMENGVAAGPLVGYHYWKDAPDIGRGNYITALAPDGSIAGGNSSKDDLDIHALRLGVSAAANLDNGFNLQAELAAIPYAHVTGVLGPHSIIEPGFYKSSPTSLTGHGYGVMGELMAGFSPTENLTIRLGGRAWYLQGDLEATFDTKIVVPNANPALNPTVINQAFVAASEYARIFRYGALVELTGRF